MPSPLPCTLLLLGILLSPIARSETPAGTKAPPPKDLTATTTPKEPEPTSTTPSRYITDENLASYVTSHSAMFSMRGRTTDPFGQLQDPDAKPIVKTTVAKASHRVVQLQATPLSDIVRLLKVTTIMPKEKSFLLGTRAIKQGDTIPLNYHGKTLRVEVSAVTSRQIQFRNLDNNETASLKLDLLPAGMTPGTRLMTTPGMMPDRPDAPIELESGTYQSNEKSPTR